MKKYLIVEDHGKFNHAGSKARKDVEAILLDSAFIPITVRKFPIKGVLSRLKQFFVVLSDWLKVLRTTEKQSTIVLQVPVLFGQKYVCHYLKLLRKFKKVKSIMLIHDLEFLRGLTKSKTTEIKLLQQGDVLICHNQKMQSILEQEGLTNLLSINIFDYLLDEHNIEVDIKKTLSNQVMIAGNLSPHKSQYVYQLHEIEQVQFHLYGPNYEATRGYEAIKYFGQFLPEELIKHLVGDFGLVWDGDSLETCSGLMGEYLKINNPHKTSLYLVAGFPVIIWQEAAMASFVRQEDVGIVVSTLKEIPAKLAEISTADYERMLRNVKKISAKLKDGEYTKAVIQTALAQLYQSNQ